MMQTMTWVGLDVHARSTHAAVVDAETGELRRARLGGGTDEVMRFLGALRGPVRVAYEAGPTGFGLVRAASAEGIEMIVVAPGKTPRAAADRIKTDQRDAELLVRLLMAGSLRAIHVPSATQEAARDLVRAREALRQPARARQARQRRDHRRRTRAQRLHLGRSHRIARAKISARSLPWAGGGRRHARSNYGQPHQATPVPRQRRPASKPGS